MLVLGGHTAASPTTLLPPPDPAPLCPTLRPQVAYKVVDKRPGDSTAVWAATETAERELGWVSGGAQRSAVQHLAVQTGVLASAAMACGGACGAAGSALLWGRCGAGWGGLGGRWAGPDPWPVPPGL
jgi:hypothetical protein